MEGSSSQVVVFGGRSQSCRVTSRGGGYFVVIHRCTGRCQGSERDKTRPNDFGPSITVCKQGMTMSSKTSYTESQQAFLAHTYADATHHRVEGLSILTLDLNPEPFHYKHLLFTTHVVFLQHLDSSPLDLCCFSLHLCRLSPILTVLFRSLSLSRLIVSPLLTLLSFLDFSSVIHFTWSPHVTCDNFTEYFSTLV